MKTQIVAHRGIRTEIPENTLPSIEQALRLSGITGVEFDVELTDVPCVLHQETMVPDASFRKLLPANRNFTSRDWVKEKSFAELQTLDAGSWLSSEWAELKIPSLSEVLQCNWEEKIAFIELKDPGYWSNRTKERPQQIVRATRETMESFAGKIEIISFNEDILRVLLEESPSFPRIFALWFEWEEKIEVAFQIAAEAQIKTLNLADRMLLKNNDWLIRARDSGISLFVYPVSPAVNEPEYINWNPEMRKKSWDQLLELEVDGIITDFPRELLEFAGIK